MRLKLLDVLACPKCQRSLTCRVDEHGKDGEITAGILSCEGCGQEYPITAGIPRFVALDNYAASFGYQWNRFKSEQIDSVNGTKLSAKRFYSETGWTKEWLQDKWILDAGCGAGRFIDVASDSGAEVVGLDISNAIDAAKANLAGRNNVHFVQASIYEPPFLDAAFDGLYCIGVIQHTPDPPAASGHGLEVVIVLTPPLASAGSAVRTNRCPTFATTVGSRSCACATIPRPAASGPAAVRPGSTAIRSPRGTS